MIFYDVLSAARDGATKTTIRRQLGLTFHQFKERSEFLLTGGYLRKISNIKGVTNYVTTVEGYKLLYFMAVVYQRLGSFFPCRKGTGQLSLSGIETDLTNLVFNIPAS